MKSSASVFFLLLFLSINCYGLTSYCYHDGGLTPTLRNMGSYTNTDYLLDTQHAIRSRLYSPISDTDWDIITMQSGGGSRTVSLGVTGQYGSWVFDGASMRGFYESPIFWAAPGYEECDHTFINNEVTTTLTVSDNTVKAGDSITITWSG